MRRHDRVILRLLLLCVAAMVLCSLQWTLPSVMEEDRVMKEYHKYEKWKKEQLAYIDKDNLRIIVRDIIKELGFVNNTIHEGEKLLRLHDRNISEIKRNDKELVKGDGYKERHEAQLKHHNIGIRDAVHVKEENIAISSPKYVGNEIKDVAKAIVDEEEKRGVLHDNIVAKEVRGANGGTEETGGALQYKEVVYPSFVEFSPEDGPGEYGKGYTPQLNATERQKMEKMETIHHFNVYVSDLIGIHRRLPDARPQACRDIKYQSNLPSASVIICFHNEAWTVLLRTVHSVIDRSPPHLLREIILVDDFSERDHLKAPLDKYMSQLPKVRLLRAPGRGGLTRSRLIGYNAATGPVLVFLDSHIECFPGWLEPLLDRVATNPRIVPFPHVLQIMTNDFSFGPTDFYNVGFFHWTNLEFDWLTIPEAEQTRRKTEADPARSSTMPGGLFAIDRNFFSYLGAYDPGLLYWGGENMELSFKTRAWLHSMCGQCGTLGRQVVYCPDALV